MCSIQFIVLNHEKPKLLYLFICFKRLTASYPLMSDSARFERISIVPVICCLSTYPRFFRASPSGFPISRAILSQDGQSQLQKRDSQ